MIRFAVAALFGLLAHAPSAHAAELLPAHQTADPYFVKAETRVAKRSDARRPQTRAKNVILFIGDGMGISTITAARIRGGELAGMTGGEAFDLAMDTLPHSALVRVYAHDAQVPDSAATATAMVSGMKTRIRTLGVTSAVQTGRCAGSDAAQVTSLFDLAEDQGRATGLVTTTRITHATPAAAYAHTPMRNWEADSDLTDEAMENGCLDIARQLIAWPHGDGLEVVLGGGRRAFLPATTADPEYPDMSGARDDGQDLTQVWANRSPDHIYLWNADQFAATDFTSSRKVLGLFEPSHMHYDLDRKKGAGREPSIAEMTEAAINRLSQDEDGYVLMVEGGRIDHAHHAVNAARALQDTLAFDAAIAKALNMTSADDTLIIVTADHSHVFTIAGYPGRGNPILGLARWTDGNLLTGSDGLPYTTLTYANGASVPCSKPANETAPGTDCRRADLTGADTTAPDFRQPALVPMGSETHAGEDVAALASGPHAPLVSGVIDQNELFHIMARALGLLDTD